MKRQLALKKKSKVIEYFPSHFFALSTFVEEILFTPFLSPVGNERIKSFDSGAEIPRHADRVTETSFNHFMNLIKRHKLSKIFSCVNDCIFLMCLVHYSECSECSECPFSLPMVSRDKRISCKRCKKVFGDQRSAWEGFVCMGNGLSRFCIAEQFSKTIFIVSLNWSFLRILFFKFE